MSVFDSLIQRQQHSGSKPKMANTKRKGKATFNALSKAKTVYAARGDVNSCGDWLTLALKQAFRTDDGNFDLTAFKACLKENDIEPPKVDMERYGAIGRFRMCAGLTLRRHALKVGHLIIGGKKITAPGAKKRGRKAKQTEVKS